MLLYLVVEIVALVALASWIGFAWTLLVLLAGSVLGLWLARREGLRAVRAMAEAARDHRVAHVETDRRPAGGDGRVVAAGPRPGHRRRGACSCCSRRPASLVRRRMVREAERRAPVLRTARIRGDGSIVDGEVVRRRSSAWADRVRARRPSARRDRGPDRRRARPWRVRSSRVRSSRVRSSKGPTPGVRPRLLIGRSRSSSQLVVQRTVTRTGSGSRPSSRTSGAASARAIAAIAERPGLDAAVAGLGQPQQRAEPPAERGRVALRPVTGVGHRARLCGAPGRGRVLELPVRAVQRSPARSRPPQ